jgi:hypothetical protein
MVDLAGELMGGRVSLTPRPVRGRTPALEAAMLGHLPGRVRLDRLRPAAREAMRAVGLGEAVDHLGPVEPQRLSAGEVARVRALEHLPVPLLSAAELDDIFPDARSSRTAYRSLLAGERAWLPQAVDDYFANGGERLWVLRVPEGEGRDGFLPRSADAPDGTLALHRPLGLRGLAALLPLPDLAVAAAPDLERLLIPARLPDIPRVRLANPPPRFAPCGQGFDDGHRERRRGEEMPEPGEPDASLGWIAAVLGALARWRPDVQFLHSLPLQYSGAVGGPSANVRVLDVLADLAAGRQPAEPDGPLALRLGLGPRTAAGLRRIQLLFPYLRGPGVPLASPVGLVAGRQAWVARREGAWRSMAGQPLVTGASPYPLVTSHTAERLRGRPGVGVLVRRRGRVELEDERLAVPALHPDDWLHARDRARFDGFCSGEVSRFLGWLMRRLRALGESLVFDLDPADPRPRLLLDELFRSLFTAGALRGSLPEEAFSIRPGVAGAGIIAYDIELAPAFPIDRLRLTFANRDGEWQAQVVGSGAAGGGGGA